MTARQFDLSGQTTVDPQLLAAWNARQERCRLAYRLCPSYFGTGGNWRGLSHRMGPTDRRGKPVRAAARKAVGA